MPGHGAVAPMQTGRDHFLSALTKFWRDLYARTRPPAPLLGAQARWQHSASRNQQARLQQLTLGGVLAMFVLALLYFDSGSSRHRTSTAVTFSKSSGSGKEQLSQHSHTSNVGSDDKAFCRALSLMQVCSHRSSLGQSDKGNDAPFLDRMTRLAANGIVCYDIDAVITADGQLVVGYPNHIATELRAAGRSVAPGQLDTVSWAEYVSAGLDKRHPLLRDVLESFAKILAEQEKGDSLQVAGPGARTTDNGNDAVSASTTAGAGAGDVVGGFGSTAQSVTETAVMEARADVAAAGGVKEQQARKDGTDTQPATAQGDKPQEEQQQKQLQQALGDQQQVQRQEQQPAGQGGQQQQGQTQTQQQAGKGRRRRQLLREHGGGKIAQGQQQPEGKSQSQGQGRAAVMIPVGPLLLIELKDSAMRISTAEVLHNVTQVLGIQGRVGLWMNRAGPPTEGSLPQVQTQAISEHLQRLGSSMPKVLGLPDTRRLTNGTRVPLPLTLQPGDATAYDMFGPSVKHSDAALAEVVAAAGGRPVVTWVVDTMDEATKVARAGGGLIVANDPLVMRDKLRAMTRVCNGAVDAATTAATALAAVEGSKAGGAAGGGAG